MTQALFAEISQRPLMISHEYHKELSPLLQALFKSEEAMVKSYFFQEAIQCFNLSNALESIAAKTYINNSTFFNVPLVVDQTAIVIISGLLLQDDYYAKAGMRTIAKWMKELADDDSINAVVLLINSGGGTAAGTFELCAAIADCAKLKKTETVVDGMAASAAYKCALATSKISLSSPTSLVGSIGTMMSTYNDSKFWEEIGVVFTDIYADDATLKNYDERKFLEGDESGYKEILNELNNMFTSFAKKMRPNLSENALAGKHYIGKSAIENNLADGFETIELKIKNISKNKNNSVKMEKEYVKMSVPKSVAGLARMSGATDIEDTESNDNQVQALSTELNASRERINGLTTQLQTEKAENNRLSVENANLSGQVEAFKAMQGLTHTQAVGGENNAPSEDLTLEKFIQKIKS